MTDGYISANVDLASSTLLRFGVASTTLLGFGPDRLSHECPTSGPTRDLTK
jgi:hypothetical protein